jgi:ABC-type dipeptide/oligopeptide/nickel transport system ATPase component
MLIIDNLSVGFKSGPKTVQVLENITMNINDSDRVSLVGESGCGKTILALAIMNLLPRNSVITGNIHLGDYNLLKNNNRHVVRGKSISICWSSPEKYFNPSKIIGEQIGESFLIHHPGERRLSKEKTFQLLSYLNFDEPEKIYRSYPFELSGGMNQRAMIAMSIINEPELLILDEPSRGLDDVNRDILIELINKINCRAILIITHDMYFAGKLSNKIAIMKNGKIVEENNSDIFFNNPNNEYSRYFLSIFKILSK